MFEEVTTGGNAVTDRKWAVFLDSMLENSARKNLCLQNYRIINKIGNVRTSPKAITRNFLAALIR